LNNAEKNMEKNKPMTIEEATRAIYEATNNMRWISVSDKLPQRLGKYEEVDVIAVSAGIGVFPARYYQGRNGFKGSWYDLSDSDQDGGHSEAYNVTHWMPLPPAPKQ